MTKEMFGEIGSNLIGLLLMIALVFVFKNKKELNEKKVFGFPVLNCIYLMIVYFSIMIIYAILK